MIQSTLCTLLMSSYNRTKQGFWLIKKNDYRATAASSLRPQKPDLFK